MKKLTKDKLLKEAKSVRERVSGYSNGERTELSKLAKEKINFITPQDASILGYIRQSGEKPKNLINKLSKKAKVVAKEIPLFNTRKHMLDFLHQAYRHVLDNASLTGKKRLTSDEEHELGYNLGRYWSIKK